MKYESAAERFFIIKSRALMADRWEVAKKFQRELENQVTSALREKRRQLECLTDTLRLLAPDHVLRRGYSITADAKMGSIIRGAASVKKGQKLRTRVADGEFGSTVD